MKTAFKKDQLVTVLSSYDNKGTVAYRHEIVYSCGQKRMILTDATTGEETGQWSNPQVGNVDDARTRYNWSGVFPRMTDAVAEAQCLKAGALVIECQRDHFADCIRRHPDNAAYIRAIEKDLGLLHEPRFLKR